ncbi:MAG: hypothetical protein ACK5MJ_05815 [Alphaproteobacteria bacterium]
MSNEYADIYQSVQIYVNSGFASDFDDCRSFKGDFGIRVRW